MAWHSYLTHLECSRCHASGDADVVTNTCVCGAPMLARYDLDALKEQVSRSTISGRPHTLWRYREMLPVRSESNAVGFGEGMTPITPVLSLASKSGWPSS